MPGLPDVMTTERLILRPPRTEDAQPIFEGFAQDREVTRYLTWRPHPDIGETEARLGEWVSGWPERHEPWMIERRSDGELLGQIACRLTGHGADIGYVLKRSEWGNGIMTEAVIAVVQMALARPDIYRVWATCDVENVASARVLEKAGMSREGVLRRWIVHPNISAEPRDCYAYGRVR